MEAQDTSPESCIKGTGSRISSITAWIVFLCASLLVLGYAMFSRPGIYGDGLEYLLMTQSLLDHASLDLRTEDVTAVLAAPELKTNYPECENALHQLHEMTTQGNPDHFAGYFRAENGKYYSYHFCLYPAYVTLVRMVFGNVGFSPLTCFQIGNALLFIAVFAYGFFSVRTSLLRRLLLVGTYGIGGSIFYLKWTHPEIFITALLFVAFVGLFQKRMQIALPLLALVAVQVVSIWPAYLAGLLFLVLTYRKDFPHQLLALMKRWWVWVCAVAPAASMVFFFIHYGKPSIINELCTDMRLLTFRHFLNFWLDPDQGVFVGLPWLILFLILFLIRIRKQSRECLTAAAVAFFAAVLIILPLLTQANINHGQSIFSRHALWAMAPVTAWCGYYFADIAWNLGTRILVFLSAIAYTTAFAGSETTMNTELEHKVWTNWLLHHYPQYYNPDPYIFWKRSENRHNPTPYYRDEQGRFRKILLYKGWETIMAKKLCRGTLVDENGKPVDLTKLTAVQYDYGYLNGCMTCQGEDMTRLISTPIKSRYTASLQEGIDFRKAGFPDFVETVMGLSGCEGWGRWSNSDAVLVKINQTLPKSFTLELRLGSMGGNVGKTVTVTIGDVSREFTIRNSEPALYAIPFELNGNLSGADIMIRVPPPIRPCDISQSGDKRRLSLSFINMRFVFPQ